MHAVGNTYTTKPLVNILRSQPTLGYTLESHMKETIFCKRDLYSAKETHNFKEPTQTFCHKTLGYTLYAGSADFVVMYGSFRRDIGLFLRKWIYPIK